MNNQKETKRTMKIKNVFYPLLLVMAAMTMTACSSTEEDAVTTKAGQTGTFQVSINIGPAQTRAISVGGNDCHTLYTNWDNGDKVRVVQGTTKLEQLTADVSAGNTAYATLTGTLTGTFAVNDVLTLYYHDADLDYTGQTGTIGCVSTSKSFLTATSAVQQIGQATGTISDNGGYLVMSNASYSPMQAYLDISFTDTDDNALAITQLDIWTSDGKLVKTAPLGSDKTYATEASPLTVTPNAATDHIFLALRDEAGISNTFYFKATTATNDTYIYSQDLNLAIGGYYYAATPKAMTGVRVKPTITRGDGGTVPEPDLSHSYTFNPNGITAIDVTFSGTSRGYSYDFNAVGTIHLNSLQADNNNVIINGTEGDLVLDLSGNNSIISINNTAHSIAVNPDYNLYLRGNGTLTVSGKNSMQCGLYAKNYMGGEDPSVLAANGYTVTRSERVDGPDADLDFIPDYYTWTYTVAHVGSLSSKFTVNASGGQVYFSKGNLQATTSNLGIDWSWTFATHQYDYIGNAAANNTINGNGTVSANGTVDLFGWVGESSSWTGAAMYGISNSEDIGLINGYGIGVSESLKSDWGSTIGTGWRTLTSDEWAYLLNTRSTTSGIRYAKATVNSKAGIILLPDDWSTSYYSLASTNTTSAAFTTNSITDSDWTNSLEAHGAVFLPTAGRRLQSSAWGFGTFGSYWSSSPAASKTMAEASQLYFNNDGMILQHTPRLYGNSVRLVRDAY